LSDRNLEYDFKWCPGCGDFGVKRALEQAIGTYTEEFEIPRTSNVIVAGIGCSGNMVHLIDGEQPFGIHGIHGRTLPIAFGVSTSRPDLNTIIVAGDGDFLSIGGEHIGPSAARNPNITCIVMDNGVYGLTKGQSSPTSDTGQITTSTPFGKMEAKTKPLELYLSYGVSYIASHYSSKPKILAQFILEGMKHKGLSIIHVQSPCTTYNDTYDILKGDRKKGIPGTAFIIEEDHDPSDYNAALSLLQKGGVPLGLIFKKEPPTINELQDKIIENKSKKVEDILASYSI
jgi:2-oxoglutarate ferredoxin oxidoreductase subunit beta|tara:strand:+ start:9152 stop:10012 length:861 start_codon:yes stop_codon:yes gene_type:complete